MVRRFTLTLTLSLKGEGKTCFNRYDVALRRCIVRVCVTLTLFIGLCAACSGPSPVAPTPPTEPPPSIEPPPPPTPRELSVTGLLAFGDSITEGAISLAVPQFALTAGLEVSYPYKLQAMLGERYSTQTIAVGNAGRSGERAEQGVARLPGVLTETQPELVLLLEGVNDLNLYGAAGLQRTLAKVGEMIALCQMQGRQVMVGTLPPERPGGFRAGAIALIEPFNNGLKDVVRSQGASLVDVHAGFGGDLSLLGADGLHPTEAGYQRIAETFFEAIQQQFDTPRQIAILRDRGRPWPER